MILPFILFHTVLASLVPTFFFYMQFTLPPAFDRAELEQFIIPLTFHWSFR